MKKVILVMVIASGFISCSEEKKSGYDIAIENARSYIRGNLGADSVEYEEGTWGPIEPHQLDFTESNFYKLYTDTLVLMEARVSRINDSISLTAAETPDYISLTKRRDDYQRELEDYRLREAERRLMYERTPEVRGYWLKHEYRLKGEPIKVHILLGDTVKYTPSGLIYK